MIQKIKCFFGWHDYFSILRLDDGESYLCACVCGKTKVRGELK